MGPNVRSERQAALLAETASREDYNTAAMTLAAEVANPLRREYLPSVARSSFWKSSFKPNRTYLELVELRFFKSMVSALDVYQQKQVVEKVEAEIPLVEQQEQPSCFMNWRCCWENRPRFPWQH